MRDVAGLSHVRSVYNTHRLALSSAHHSRSCRRCRRRCSCYSPEYCDLHVCVRVSLSASISPELHSGVAMGWALGRVGKVQGTPSAGAPELCGRLVHVRETFNGFAHFGL